MEDNKKDEGCCGELTYFLDHPQIKRHESFGNGKSPMIKREDGSKSPRGLWDNIRAKQESGDKMRKPGAEGAPTAEALKKSQPKPKKDKK